MTSHHHSCPIDDPADDPLRAGRPTLRPSGMRGMLAVVPYLLGFHPEESLVCVLLRDRRVVLTLRQDLTNLLDPAEGSSGAGRVRRHLLEHARRTAATGMILISYEERPDPVVAAAYEAFVDGLRGQAMIDTTVPELLDAVRVADGRWWSGLCHDATCCPPEGFDYAEVLCDPAAAEAVLGGLPALGSREELREAVRPGTVPTDDAYVDALAAAWVWSHDHPGRPCAVEMDRLLSTYEDGWAMPGPEDLAWLTVLTRSACGRDVASLRVTAATSLRWAALWSAAARQSFGAFAAGPVALCGLAAWARGDGATLVVCVEQAQELCAELGLVRILGDVADSGLAPEVWERMRAEMLDEYGPLGADPTPDSPITARGR